MRNALLILAAIGLTAFAPMSDPRDQQREQEAAFRATKDGRFLPLPVIESHIVPRMRGADYLGPELNAAAGRYRLKFMREGRVIWVDVDARTGRVVGKSGG